MSVTTVFGDAADGRVLSTHLLYATAREGLGTVGVSTTESASICGQRTGGADFDCYQIFLAFDTSGIPDTDDISAVDLSLWLAVDTSTTDFVTNVYGRDWGATVTTADFVAGSVLSSLTLVATKDSNGIGSTGAYKLFTENGGSLRAWIDKTGFSRFMCASARQQAGTQPTGEERLSWQMADTGGTTQDPKLVITHAPVELATQPVVAPSMAAQQSSRW